MRARGGANGAAHWLQPRVRGQGQPGGVRGFDGALSEPHPQQPRENLPAFSARAGAELPANLSNRAGLRVRRGSREMFAILRPSERNFGLPFSCTHMVVQLARAQQLSSRARHTASVAAAITASAAASPPSRPLPPAATSLLPLPSRLQSPPQLWPPRSQNQNGAGTRHVPVPGAGRQTACDAADPRRAPRPGPRPSAVVKLFGCSIRPRAFSLL